MNTEKVACPICHEEFSSTVIEAHASRCLFLNESNDGPQSLLKDSSPRSRSVKIRTSSTLKSTSTMKRKSSGHIITSTESKDIAEDTEIHTSSLPKKLRGDNHVPLAERMRPTTFETYIGQNHVLGSQAILSKLLHKAEIPNIILWGPPGCGKTSLANVIAHICRNKTNNKMRYVKLSAAVAGVSDIKEVVNVAANELKFGRRTVVFMDEIHRFNKSQQDVFLPHVESGTITLIGATTENPSFSLNSALLSRCRVVVLEKLSVPNVVSILTRAVLSLGGTIVSQNSNNSVEPTNEEMSKIFQSTTDSSFIVDEPTIEWLAETSDGDARIALGGLELAIQSRVPNDHEQSKSKSVSITLDDIKEGLKKTHMLYDRKGDQHYDIISALHKSVRASDENASLYWLARMLAGGEDPMYIARRLVRMACEDIGLEDPRALSIAVHTMHGCKMIGMPECDVLLAQCTTYLARAPKSRLMEDALRAAQRVITNHKGPQPGVPLHLRNAPTTLMKKLGYGKGYNMLNKNDSGLSYLPEGLEHLDFFLDDDNAS